QGKLRRSGRNRFRLSALSERQRRRNDDAAQYYRSRTCGLGVVYLALARRQQEGMHMARVAIVTGGTRGIGEAISLALKDKGVTVAANYTASDDKARAFTERTGIKSYKWDV